MAKQIMEYETADGKRFPTKLAAEKWAKVLEIAEAISGIQDNLDYSLDDLTIEGWAEMLVDNFKISVRKAKDDEVPEPQPVDNTGNDQDLVNGLS